MPDVPNGHGLAWLLAAKLVCCGALVLAATGALSMAGLVGWLSDGGYFWLGIAALAIAALFLWQRHRSTTSPAERGGEDKGKLE